ncbi:MAG: class II fructose-bisphosphate aldolase [Clostridiales bacterium]|nr:class II fructose-bisphosphate aldolase [Clostridiales bacterium]
MGELTRSIDLLLDARKRGYAVPAYNVFSYESTKTVLRAAEQAGTPVILMHHFSYGIDLETFAVLTRELGRQSKVPFSIHLDHAPDYEECIRAIRAGFSSVMIDGSPHPFDENVKMTQDVVRAARACGVDVEGEIGHVGFNDVDRTLFTRPEEVTKFLELTEVDSLAISIGNSHGVYFEEPRIEQELLKTINKISPVPLVLHGTSGIPDEQLSEAVANGIVKTNIATEYMMYMADAMKEALTGDNPPPTAPKLMMGIEEKVAAFIERKMRLLNPANISIL